jgi:hypothetical protein
VRNTGVNRVNSGPLVDPFGPRLISETRFLGPCAKIFGNGAKLGPWRYLGSGTVGADGGVGVLRRTWFEIAGGVYCERSSWSKAFISRSTAARSATAMVPSWLPQARNRPSGLNVVCFGPP